MSQPLPPGCYHDPLGGPGARYWNGSEWDGSAPVDAETAAVDLPSEPPKRSKLLIPILVGAAVGLTVVVIALIVMWPKKEEPRAATTTPVFPSSMFTPPTLTSTVTPAPAIAEVLRGNIQRKFDSDPDLAKLLLTLLDITLVHKGGNEYKGYIDVRAGNGATQDVPIDVTADPDNILWQLPPGWTEFATPATTTPSRTFPVPGADPFGFLDGPRCSMLNTAVLVIRTEQSQVVICRVDAPDAYTYHAKRMSDGSQISLNARPMTGGGFSAVDQTGSETHYQVTRDGVIIETKDDTRQEPAIAAGP